MLTEKQLVTFAAKIVESEPDIVDFEVNHKNQTITFIPTSLKEFRNATSIFSDFSNVYLNTLVFKEMDHYNTRIYSATFKVN